MNTTAVSEMNAKKVTKRTEQLRTVVESQENYCGNKSNEKKMESRAVIGTSNVTQFKKLGKNAAKKRRRAQLLETTISGVQNLDEIQPRTIVENNKISVESIGMAEATEENLKSGDVNAKLNNDTDQNVPVEEQEQISENGDQTRKSYVDVCKDTVKKTQDVKSGLKDENCVLKEIDEHLFNLSRDIPLALCIAEDLQMKGNIADQFKRYFGGIGQLFDQKLSTGNVGTVVNHRKEIAFYLVTKKYTSGCTTMQSLSDTLKSLLAKMKELKLTKLGIPKIGCSFDGLDWSEVRKLIVNVFAGSEIKITVCVPSKLFYRIPSPQLKVFTTPKNMLEIADKMSDVLLFIDLDRCQKNDWKNDLVDEVNIRYPTFKEKLLKDIKRDKLKPGDVRYYPINKERIVCLFTSQSAYYTSIESGVINIKNTMRCYRNFAIQSGPMKQSEKFEHISRTVLILRSIIYSSELWLCGNTDQSQDKELYEEYCRKLNIEKRLSTRPTNYNERKGGRVVNRNTSKTNFKRHQH